MLQQALLLIILAGATQALIAGQLSGTLGLDKTYPADTEITDFVAGKAFQGFTTENGRLKVPESGLYYIYAQAFFESYSSAPEYHNRVALSVNGAPFRLMQTGLGGKADYGSVFTGGVIQLQEGDYINLKTVTPSKLWVTSEHTFIGAYKIDGGCS